LICWEYTWPGLRTFVKDYISFCTSCCPSQNPETSTLWNPEKPWNSISMDFIEQLPSSSGFTAILVVVDCLTKQAIFILTHDTIDSPPTSHLIRVLSATTGLSLFFANKGYHLNISVYPGRDMTLSCAQEYAVDLQELHEFLCTEMAHTQKHCQGPADARQLPAPGFKVEDQVFIKAKYFRSTQPSKKLSEKNLGLYPIITQVRSLSFTLRLPDSMCAVHPVFHVSQLEPTVPNIIPNRTQPPPPPIEVDGEPEYDIEEILDSKIDHRHQNCQLLYLVKWAGYCNNLYEQLPISLSDLRYSFLSLISP
jgi:hypothetical protein